MPSAKSAVIGNHEETSLSATCLAIENALNCCLTGSTPEDKGYGVQQIRDAEGKIVEVVVFFDDKVPASEKSAALAKIARNDGVATVDISRGYAVVNFDQYAIQSSAGRLSLDDDPTLFFSATSSGSLFSIQNSAFVSSPKALKVDLSIVGTNSWASSKLQLGPFWNMPGTRLAAVATAHAGFSVRFDAGFGAEKAGDFGIQSPFGFKRPLADMWRGTPIWGEPGNAGTGDTVMRFLNLSGFFTPTGPNAALDIPMDGAFHRVELDYFVGAQLGVDISVDGGAPQRYTTTNANEVVLANTVFYSNINVRAGTGASAPVTKTYYVDDVVFDYTLA